MDDLDGLTAEFACWEQWRGVNGVFYARRMRSSPPIVFRAETLGDLRKQVREHIAQHCPGVLTGGRQAPRPPW